MSGNKDQLRTVLVSKRNVPQLVRSCRLRRKPRCDVVCAGRVPAFFVAVMCAAAASAVVVWRALCGDGLAWMVRLHLTSASSRVGAAISLPLFSPWPWLSHARVTHWQADWLAVAAPARTGSLDAERRHRDGVADYR